MANELRIYQDLLGGRISDNPLTSGATTLNSAALAEMLAVGSTQHMMIVLDPDGVSGLAPEIVMVTAHTAAESSCTIARAQQGTTARAHAQGTDWVHSVLASDIFSSVWTAYTPTWAQQSGTGPTLGNGVISGKYRRVGQVGDVWLSLVMGSTTTYGDGANYWTFSLPAGWTTDIPGTASQGLAVGSGYAFDAGTAHRAGVVRVLDAETVMSIVQDGANNGWNSTRPHTWANTDQLSLHVMVPLV